MSEVIIVTVFFVAIIIGGLFGALAGGEKTDKTWNARIERGWYVCDDDREKLCIITVERREVTR